MIAPHNLEPIVSAGATVLADSLAVGTAVAVLAGLLNLVLRQRSAAMRFTVLMAALVATASLPLVRLAFDHATVVSGTASLLHVTESWAPWIFVLWTVIATIGLVRIVIGVAALRRVRRNCKTAEIAALGAELVTTHCPARKLEFLVSAEATVPAAIGLFRPAVVLPEWVIREMSRDELRHVIIHELSHLRRWDDWTNLLQQVVKALFFFHPAVWWMEGRLSLEREMACDDAVLKDVADARSYAECLAHIAERSFLRRGLAMAQAAVSRVRQTSRRVARILKFDSSAGTREGKLWAVLATAVTITGLGFVWQTPVLFSFDSKGPAVSAAVRAPEMPIAALKPINAAWHEPVRPLPQPAAPRLKAAVRRNQIEHHAVRQQDDARMVRTSLTAGGQRLTRSVLIVVMDDGEQVSVWHITTWQYSPSEQVRSARKTT